MRIHSVRALNTTAGRKDYTIAVIGDHSELSAMKDALDSCGMKTEVAFLYNQESKDGGSSSLTMYSTVQGMVCGRVGDKAVGAKRENLFCYSGELHITYDDGVGERKDFPLALYAEPRVYNYTEENIERTV